jgi:hypothetical protein
MMYERRLLDLELTAGGNCDLDLKEACIEIRRCHRQIDAMLAANPQDLDRRRAAELRTIAAESCQALEEATARILAGALEQPCTR